MAYGQQVVYPHQGSCYGQPHQGSCYGQPTMSMAQPYPGSRGPSTVQPYPGQQPMATAYPGQQQIPVATYISPPTSPPGEGSEAGAPSGAGCAPSGAEARGKDE